jgi:hypothetical protein
VPGQTSASALLKLISNEYDCEISISYLVAAQLNSLVRHDSIKRSGRGVGAGIHLEVADNGAIRRGSALSGEERRMATHRLAAFPLTALSRGPGRMRPKENNRRPRCVRHDSNSFQEQPRKSYEHCLSVTYSRMPGQS